MAVPASDDALADLADAVLEIARAISPRPDELRDLGSLTRSEVAVVRKIWDHPGVTPTQVAAMTGLARSNLSTIVRSLEGRGLVERRAMPGDERSIELTPTPLAGENLGRLRLLWAARLRQVPDETLEGALGAADRVRELAAALAAAPGPDAASVPADR